MEEKQNNDIFLLGIRCYTYNQSQYITDALNGFTMQQTTFPYIAMVVDDASTDGEQEVIAQYVEENFDTNNSKVAYKKETDYAHITYAKHKTNENCYIVVLYLKENHYRKKPKLPYLSQWRNNTKYEALCEGDDYWIDPLKLQKQVDFLEENPEYGLVHTRYNKHSGNGKYIGKSKANIQLEESFLSLLESNTIGTLTVCYRTYLLNNINKDYQQQSFKMGDYPLWLELSRLCKIKYISDITSTYRVLENSASHSSDIKKTLSFIINSIEIKIFFINKYNIDNMLSKVYQEKYYYLALLEATKHQIKTAFMLYIKSHRYNLYDFIRFIRYIFK